jgi:hypothetical protein
VLPSNWRFVGYESEVGIDYVTVEDERSVAWITSTTDSTSLPSECVEQEFAFLISLGASDISFGVNATGEQALYADTQNSWSIIYFTYTAEDASTSRMAASVQCWRVAALPNVMMAFTAAAPSESFSGAIPSIRQLMRGLTVTSMQTQSSGSVGQQSGCVVGINLPDSDCDGLDDESETLLGGVGYSPTNPDDSRDSDGDGVTDAWEKRVGTDPNVSDMDYDSDWLSDVAERQWGTNPIVMDSDNDYVWDGVEVRCDTDPLNAASFDYACSDQVLAAYIDAMGGMQPIIDNALNPDNFCNHYDTNQQCDD